jgi:tRNA threonylcarbamoyl adenosine modification protein (Sua5/YciO/YrdC/YwlC family)
LSKSKLSDRRNRHDQYHQRARKRGFVARSVFKLSEIDDKHRIVRPNDRVLDLGCRPGSWLQYCHEKKAGALVGLDRTDLDAAIAGARILVGDVHEVEPAELLGELEAFDVVLTDMAPDTSGVRHVDQTGAGISAASQALPGAVRRGQDGQAERQPHRFHRAVRGGKRLRREALMAYVHLEIDPDRIDGRKITRAVGILHEGGVAAYPTDTVYALGCAIDSRKAVESIYRAKQMDKKQRLAVICPDVSTAAQYGHFTHQAFRLVRRILPGPYTVVVGATREVPRTLLDKKRRQVGIRIPDHAIALALARNLGRPLLTTSAFGNFDDTVEAYGQCLDVAIEGGPTPGEPSTVLELSDDGIEVLREGLGSIDDVLE